MDSFLFRNKFISGLKPLYINLLLTPDLSLGLTDQTYLRASALNHLQGIGFYYHYELIKTKRFRTLKNAIRPPAGVDSYFI